MIQAVLKLPILCLSLPSTGITVTMVPTEFASYNWFISLSIQLSCSTAPERGIKKKDHSAFMAQETTESLEINIFWRIVLVMCTGP